MFYRPRQLLDRHKNFAQGGINLGLASVQTRNIRDEGLVVEDVPGIISAIDLELMTTTVCRTGLRT